MKSLVSTALIALASLITLPAQAAGEHASHGMANHAADKMPMVEATVKKVDKSAGKVTLAHGPLVNLNMPAMTMAFKVREAGWIEQMKAGQKIRFVADNVDGAMTVVQFEGAK